MMGFYFNNLSLFFFHLFHLFIQRLLLILCNGNIKQRRFEFRGINREMLFTLLPI